MGCVMCGLIVPQSQSIRVSGLNFRTLHHPYRIGDKVLCSSTCFMLASLANQLDTRFEMEQLLLPLEGGSNGNTVYHHLS